MCEQRERKPEEQKRCSLYIAKDWHQIRVTYKYSVVIPGFGFDEIRSMLLLFVQVLRLCWARQSCDLDIKRGL